MQKFYKIYITMVEKNIIQYKQKCKRCQHNNIITDTLPKKTFVVDFKVCNKGYAFLNNLQT